MKAAFAIFGICALVVIAMPARVSAVSDYFQMTAGGSFNVYYGEGYTNGGGTGTPKLSQRGSNSSQQMGWMSFYNAVGDSSGQTIAGFVAANGGWGNVRVSLHFETNTPLAAGDATTGDYIESVRCGNSGPLVADGGSSSGPTWLIPAPGYTDASEPQAFRAGSTGYVMGNPHGVYPQGSWNYFQDGTGEAWKVPSNRALNTGNTDYTYDGSSADIVMNGSAGMGWGANKGQWALQNLLGGYAGNNGLASVDTIVSAGQLLVQSGGSPLLVNNTNTPGAIGAVNDPRNKSGDPTKANWYSIPLDTTFAMDQANVDGTMQCKSLIFNNLISGMNGLNNGYLSFYNTFNLYPYLEVSVLPEPTSLCLLTLGGLALLKRRS